MPTDDAAAAPVTRLAELLAAPPRPPVDPNLFSSNTLFGEPGIYPQGTPMEPATGPTITAEAALAALAAVEIADAAARFADAAPVLDAFVAGATPVDAIGLGATASPGRIVGPRADGSTATRVVNERYRAEVPTLLAGSLAHDLLWSGPGAGQYEEVVLHALVALVHLQLLARTPALAHTGTELARRQNSLAITLLNSRHPGNPDIAVRASDGPGTIPGGAPGMQTPDFWSIPFVDGPPVAADAPALLGAVLMLVTDATPPSPQRYDDDLGAWRSSHGMRGALDRVAQWRAAVAPATEEERLHAVHLMVVLEFVEHPLSQRVALPIEEYAHGLGVSLTLLRDARKLAKGHFAWMYLDLQRHSWYEEETIKELVRGRWEELIRSKLAYTGIVADRVIEEKWSSLRDCPAGSWGKAVADFYDRHGFPFPGERYGIYELGVRHDWVHVLAGYETTPEGELDVFAFIASSMKDERGLVLLAITLGLFQNGSIHHVAGKEIKIARADTLTDDGAVGRWVEAFRRGNLCTSDVMGTVRLFEHKDDPLDDVRVRFGVVPPRA